MANVADNGRGGTTRDQIARILLANADKPFVRRILFPDKSPTIDLGGGKKGTHLMAWGEVDGKIIVYPTIVMRGKNLQQLDDMAALDDAIGTGNFIEFATPKDAEWFSKSYKAFWEK